MRILHVTTFLQGGAGRIITALALAQQRAGHDVLVAGDSGGQAGYGTYPEYVSALQAAGVPCLTITSTFARNIELNTRAAVELRKRLTEGCDLVHAHAAIPGLVARLALGRHSAPIVHTMHGWGVAKSAEQVATDVALLNLADAVVTPSQASARHIQQLGVVEVEVIPYGIGDAAPVEEIDPRDRARLAPVIGSGAPIALCIGTIGERKNQRLLVDALRDPRLDRLHAVFIGDGDEDGLTAHALAAGVRERVHVLGYRPRADRYLSIADALVLPSRNEGLPISVLEAFRAGRPVVGSRIPEIAEAVDDGVTGALFDPDRVEALAGALAGVIRRSDAESARWAERLRATFRSRYREARMQDAYDGVYRRVGEPARRPLHR